MTSYCTADSYVPVAQFFTDKAVFVTGGTGFLGKVLVEKLLRSCPGIKVIYLLMRPKRGRDLSARLSDIINSPLFDSLKKQDPKALDKMVPIFGDIMLPELGICQADQQLLIRTVSLVFHAAATVNFDEQIRVAVKINMLGTKHLLDLCHKMMNLQGLVHVSTCYSNCDREEVEEVVYPPSCDFNNIMECTEWMNDKVLKDITPTLLGKKPNTYTFTKALGESILEKECGSIPVAIVRPSIVTSSWLEPIPGWVETLGGTTGVVAAFSRGILRSTLCTEEGVTDLVPVDVVINVMICAAWWIATTSPRTLTVYNCCTGVNNPITWKQFSICSTKYIRKYPPEHIVWYPAGRLTKSPTMNKIYIILLQLIPAYILDTVARISGKKPIMVHLQTKLRRALKMSEYFAIHEWRFKGDNILALKKRLSDEDSNNFSLDVRDIDWDKYIESYVLGVRAFIGKESPSTIPQAKKQMDRLLWIQRFVQIGFVIAVGYLCSLHLPLSWITGT